MYQDWVIWGQSPFVSAAVEFQIGHKIIGDFLFDLDGFLFELSTIVFFLARITMGPNEGAPFPLCTRIG